MISTTANLSIPTGVLRQELEGETVLLDMDSGCYFGLDEVGTCIWNAIAETGTLEGAYQVVASVYDVEEQQLRGDLQELATQLVDHGLLEVRKIPVA